MSRVDRTQSTWRVTEHEAVCTGEALDSAGTVLGRVSIRVDSDTAANFNEWHNTAPSALKKLMEAYAEDMARQAADVSG